MSEKLKFFKGKEADLPSSLIPGAIYHCTDTGNTYLATSATTKTLFSTNDIDTKYTAGTGLTLNGTEFSISNDVYTAVASKLPLSGGTMTGNILFSNTASTQSGQPNLKWKTIGLNAPYIGYASDQVDGTFILGSLKGTEYAKGLAIGGGSGNLLWKGNKVAVAGDIGNGTITITQNGTSKGTFTTNQSGNTTIELIDTGNTTYTLSGALNGNTFVSSLTPSSGTATTSTVPAMGAATASAAGKAGLVPAPTAGKQNSFLRGDGSWVVPTDTLNTAGSTNTSSKIFLIGATGQAANPQTYSHDTAYVGTDGHLYSNSKQVVNLSDTQALTNKTYNGYTLAAACAKGVTDSSSASAISTGTNLVTERDIYYGLPAINNSHTYTSSTNIYAPITGGTAGQTLVAKGATTTPAWDSTLTVTSATGVNINGYMQLDNKVKFVYNNNNKCVDIIFV